MEKQSQKDSIEAQIVDRLNRIAENRLHTMKNRWNLEQFLYPDLSSSLRTKSERKTVELSQAVACDGNYYEVAPNNSNNFPIQPGVLPL